MARELKYLKPEEVPEEWREYYDFERQRVLSVGRGEARLRIWTTCPDCGKSMWRLVTNVRCGRAPTARCKGCAAAQQRGPRHGCWAGGRHITHQGYVSLSMSLLSGPDLALVRPRGPRTRTIDEHRLVMARHLGRPLRPGEVVHHRNGIRDDNRLENLQLCTTNSHVMGHGVPYYQRLQEALATIDRLERRITELEQR